LLACSVLAAQPEFFTFAGLSLRTTMADLKERYPSSTALDTLVYLSRRHDSTVSAASEDPNVVVRPSGSLEVLGGSERPTIIEQFIAHLV
jgi:hypothetical protein